MFSTLEVLKTGDGRNYIEWDFIPEDTFTVSDYTFTVEYSEHPSDGFYVIGDPVDGAIGPLVLIHDKKTLNYNIDNYYVVVSENKTNGNRTESSASYIGMHSDGHHEAIRYAESVLYDMYYGEPCLILKRKSSGERCPECWSNERQSRIKTTCGTCDGSAFVNGYYEPMEAQIAFDADDKVSSVGKDFEDTTHDKEQARMSNYPLVRPRDIIINRDTNKRYVILQVNHTKLPTIAKSDRRISRQNYIISQLLNLKEIPSVDVEYKLTFEDAPPPRVVSRDSKMVVLGEPNKAETPLSINPNGSVVINYDSSLSVINGSLTSNVISIGPAEDNIYQGFAVRVNPDGTVTSRSGGNYIGVSISDYSEGHVVMVFRDISTSDSYSLIPGDKVYVDIDGLIVQTETSNYAGVALTNTSFIGNFLQ